MPQDTVQPEPTRRAVVDPLRRCNIRCRMCYHLHGDMSSVRAWPSVRAEIDDKLASDNDYIDVTGGETTLYPEILELVEHVKARGAKVCLISNLVASGQRIEDIMRASLDDWLVSLHGMAKTHDWIVQMEGARAIQERNMALIGARTKFRVNCVVTRWNQHELVEFAKYVTRWPVYIFNGISMNAHHAWRNDPLTKEIIADWRDIGPILEEATDVMEAAGIGVNWRYTPMCALPERLRRCVCNDLTVTFDPFEWTYDISPRTLAAHLAWGEKTSAATEEKGEPCCRCDLSYICGGQNRYVHAAHLEQYGECLTPVTGRLTGTEKLDFYLYRRHNVKTIDRRLLTQTGHHASPPA